MVRMQGGPTRGGTGTRINFYTDEALTILATIYQRATGVGVQPNPLIPNAGVQTTLLANRGAGDAFVTVASVASFNVGDLIPIYDAVNTVYRVITIITPATGRLDLDSALGFAFTAATTKVNNNDMRGHIWGWFEDTQDYYFQPFDVASGRPLPPLQLPIRAPSSPIDVMEEGVLLGNRPRINFIGGAISAVDDAGNNRFNVTVLAGPDNASYVTTATEAGLSNEKVLGTDVIMAGTNGTRPAASISGRIYVTTDAPITVQRDNGASWLAAGFQNPMTTSQDIIVGGTSGNAGRLAGGATDSVLSVIAGVLGYRYPLHASAEAALSADVTMTNANQFYDGPSVSLVAGTWVIAGTLTLTGPGTGGIPTVKLWDGTTVEGSTENLSVAGPVSLSLSGLVVLGSTTTMKISAAFTAAGGIIRAAATNNGAGNNASHIRAVRIA